MLYKIFTIPIYFQKQKFNYKTNYKYKNKINIAKGCKNLLNDNKIKVRQNSCYKSGRRTNQSKYF